MLKESKSKESRGWKFKELTFDFSENERYECETKVDNKPLKGIQISMFDK